MNWVNYWLSFIEWTQIQIACLFQVELVYAALLIALNNLHETFYPYLSFHLIFREKDVFFVEATDKEFILELLYNFLFFVLTFEDVENEAPNFNHFLEGYLFTNLPFFVNSLILEPDHIFLKVNRDKDLAISALNYR